MSVRSRSSGPAVTTDNNNTHARNAEREEWTFLNLPIPLTKMLSKIAGNQDMGEGRNPTRPYGLGFQDHLRTMARNSVNHFITGPREINDRKQTKVQKS